MFAYILIMQHFMLPKSKRSPFGLIFTFFRAALRLSPRGIVPEGRAALEYKIEQPRNAYMRGCSISLFLPQRRTDKQLRASAAFYSSSSYARHSDVVVVFKHLQHLLHVLYLVFQVRRQ